MNQLHQNCVRALIPRRNTSRFTAKVALLTTPSWPISTEPPAKRSSSAGEPFFVPRNRRLVVGSPEKSQKLWKKVEFFQCPSVADLSGSQVGIRA